MADEVKHEKAAALAENKEESSFVLDAEFEGAVMDLIPTTDDPTLPSMTFRVWVLGLIFCIILSAINTLTQQFRSVPFAISSYVVILLSYPLGKAMAATLPSVNILGMDTNPGPFTIKEHVLIGIWGSTGTSVAYGMDNLGIQQVFYGFDIGWLAAIGFLLATSVLGFGLAGVCRKYLVRPAHMIWPTVLPSVAMYTSFHKVKTSATAEDGSKHWSTMKVFGVAFMAMFIWQIFPSYIAPMLGYIPLLCYFSPKSSPLQDLGSPHLGSGVASLTLDWSNFGSATMSYPYWTAVNTFVCQVVFLWILAPIARSSSWFGEPKQASTRFNTSQLITKYGERVNAKLLLDSNYHMIDSKYEARKPIYMSPLFALSYFGSFAAWTATISQCVFLYGGDLWKRFKNVRGTVDEHDIHCKIMDQNYPEVPDWWYYFSFVFSVIVAVVVVTTTQMSMPIWAPFFAIGISLIAVIPINVVVATCGVGIAMNVISEFIIGLIRPGDPICMAAFKSLSVVTVTQATTLISDLKLGHYLKIAPRHMFISQMVSQIISIFVSYAVYAWWLADQAHVDAIIAGQNEGPWGSYNTNVFFSASMIWGAIGPKRFFFDSVYSPIIIGGLLTGVFFPPVILLASKIFGERYIPWRLVHPVLLLMAPSVLGNQAYVLTSFLVSTLTNFYIFRWHNAWWKRNNYVIAAGLDAGSGLMIMFSTLLSDIGGVAFPFWFLNPNSDDDNYKDVYGPGGDWCTGATPAAPYGKYKPPTSA